MEETYMDQPEEKKRPTIWIWIVVAIVVILGCCCLAAGGGSFFYLSSQGQNVFDLPSLLNQTLPEEMAPTLEAILPEATLLPAIDTPPAIATLQPTSPVATEASEPLGAGTEQLVVESNSGIWVVNPASGENVQISYSRLDAPTNLQEGLSPNKQYFAYVNGFGGASTYPILTVLDTETHMAVLELDLVGPLGPPAVDSVVGDPALEAARATTMGSSLAWSPDGQYLAFISAQDGDSADLYLYDPEEDTVARVSEEPGNASDLHWSPDGQYIEYSSVNSFGTGAGTDMQGIWLYDLAAQQSRQIEEVETSGEVFLGWIDDQTFIMHSWGALCECYHLRMVDVTATEQDVLINGCFTGIALNPGQQYGMLAVTQFNEDNCNCGNPLETGLYTFGAHTSLKKLTGDEFYSISYIPQGELFAILGEGGLQEVYATDGSPVNIPSEVAGLKPLPAPQGDYWAWASYYSGKTGLWITGSASPLEISAQFTGDPVWSQDGQTLYYIEDNALYQASAPDFSPALLMEEPGIELNRVTR
ncbi:MAG: hypothetical protein VB089_00300 [Anaerolineaceae bacterium]|nr:hypothetical protein [Anaerolineaceae bacterium]